MITSLRSPRVVLLTMCLAFLIQTLPLFSFRWVEDESFYSSTGYTLLTTGQVRNSFIAPNHPQTFDPRPLATPVTLATSFWAFGVNPAAARLPEFLATLALIPLVFWLGIQLSSPQAAAIAALMVSVDNALFLSARTVRPEAFVAFFGTLAVALFFRSRERGSLRVAALCGLALGLSFNYHVNGYGIAASIGILLIAEYGLSLLKARRAWVIVLASAALLIPFSVWVRADPAHMVAFRDLYSRGSTGSFGFAEMLHYEGIRYRDYLGIGNQRLSFTSYPIPLRLHIVLLIVAAFGILAVKQRRLFWILLALVVPSLIFWAREKNATARFFVILAPYFALAIGMAFVKLESPRWRRVFAVWCVLAFVSEGAANGLLLWRARQANYPSVTVRLRSLIPPGARVFGTDTFYLALHDRTYYAAGYCPFDYAIQQLGINYLILNDRVMLHGSGYGDDEMRETREQATAFVSTRADLVGNVADPFYGDLQVYRVRSSAR